MAGWFADDLGSRYWFPDLDWASFPDKAAYRAGAIALTKTFRKVADRHHLIFLVNGTWIGGSLASAGGGYPNPAKSGNALAEGGVVEHHDGEIGFFGPYGCSKQWADQSPVTHGKAFNYSVTSTPTRHHRIREVKLLRLCEPPDPPWNQPHVGHFAPDRPAHPRPLITGRKSGCVSGGVTDRFLRHVDQRLWGTIPPELLASSLRHARPRIKIVSRSSTFDGGCRARVIWASMHSFHNHRKGWQLRCS